jgi:hypothetical protein
VQKDGRSQNHRRAERCEQAYAEFDRISDALIAETLQINRAG